MNTSMHSIGILFAAFLLMSCSGQAENAAISGQVIEKSDRQVAGNIKMAKAAEPQLTNQQRIMVQSLRRSMSPVEGRWDVAVKEVGVPGIMHVGQNAPMAQQSVSKLWVAMAVMDRIERGELRDGDVVTITKNDRAVFHQPLARRVAEGPVRLEISELIEIAITRSDNMANQVLLDLAGGPEAVRNVLSQSGIEIGFGPGDRTMQAAISGLRWNPAYSDRDAFERARRTVAPRIRTSEYQKYANAPVDGASAYAMTDALEKIAMGKTPGASRIMASMSRTRTGRSRLKAGTPPGWQLMHKTGTGQVWSGRTAGFNDVGIMRAPDGRRFTVAVLIGDSSSSQKTMQSAMASTSRLVADYHAHTTTGRRNSQITGFN